MAETPIDDDYPHGKSYGHLLTWHMKRGTRADGSLKKWSSRNLSRTVFKLKEINGVLCDFRGEQRTEESARKNIENWMKLNNVPPNKKFDDVANRVIEVLFGANPIVPLWRDDLINARTRYYHGKEVDREKLAAQRAYTPSRQTAHCVTLQLAQAMVPRPTPRFMGRDEDLNAIAASLIQTPDPVAILVQGGPGIGKTELTKAVAHHDSVVKRFGDRRWFVQLDEAKNSDEMKIALSHTLIGDAAWNPENLISMTRGNPSLLILDGLDAPWRAEYSREYMGNTLREIAIIPQMTLLSSFRGVDLVSGVLWDARRLTRLWEPYSTKLFVSHAGKGVLNDPHLECLVDAMGGMPLAIELIGRRVHGQKKLSPFWEEWTAIGTDLARRPGKERSKLNSLSRSIEISLLSDGLTSEARRLFSVLGYLPDGVDFSSMVEILGVDSAFDARECLHKAGLIEEWYEQNYLLPPIANFARRNFPISKNDRDRTILYFSKLLENMDVGSNSIGLLQKSVHCMRNSLNYTHIINELISDNKQDLAFSILPSTFYLEKTFSEKKEMFYNLSDSLRRIGMFDESTKSLRMFADTLRGKHDHRLLMSVMDDVYSSIPFDNVEDKIGCIVDMATNLLRASQFDRDDDDDGGDGKKPQEYLKLPEDYLRDAYNYAKRGLKLAYRIRDRWWQARCLEMMADIEFVRREKEHSIKLYSRARWIFGVIDDADGVKRCSMTAEERWEELYYL